MADKEATRQIAEAIVVSSALDFCKSPTTPVGYMIMSYFASAVTTEGSVQMTKCEAFTMKSRLSTVWGDEPGIGGGIISGVNLGYCRPTTYTKKVKCKGEWLCRHDTEMEMNCAGPDGPFNVKGCVIYVKCVGMSTANPDGSITGKTKPDEAPPAAPKNPHAPKSDSFFGQLWDEASKQVNEGIDAVMQDASDLWDIATDPEAAQQALENMKEAGSELITNPGQAVEDAVTGVGGEFKEEFQRAQAQDASGNSGGMVGTCIGIGAMGAGILRKIKDLPRHIKDGRRRRKGNHGRDDKGGHDSKKDSKTDSQDSKSNNDSDSKQNNDAQNKQDQNKSQSEGDQNSDGDDKKNKKDGEDQEKEHNGGQGPKDDGALVSRKKVNPKLSDQKQGRHQKDGKNWEKEGKKGYMNNKADAQEVLDAYNNGEGKIVGYTKGTNDPIFEYDKVTGYNNNYGANIVDQPTNRFVIKDSGTGSHVIPTSPFAGG